jgi:hypothetical protein
MRDPNRDQLVAAAEALRPLLPELVFVGGCVTGLLITDQAAAEPRGTLDVDAIAEITSYAQYAGFGERLRHLGFHEDSREGAPVCRWIHGRTILDVMPLDEDILGFSNRWYKDAMQTSVATISKTSSHLLTDAKFWSLKYAPRELNFTSLCAATSRNCWQIPGSWMHFQHFFFPI